MPVHRQNKPKQRKRKKISGLTVAVCLGALAATIWLGCLLLVARNSGQKETERDEEVLISLINEKEETSVLRKRQGGYEKPMATDGLLWQSTAWRASSEPGGKYMSGPALNPERLSRLAENEKALYTGTQSGDSYSVEAVLGNCTSVRPPRLYPILDILRNWPPDLIQVPPRHFASLCRFDYQKEKDLALEFRDAEIPFIIYNEHRAMDTAAKWSTEDFLIKRLGSKKYRTERSDDNHFMYYMEGGRGLRGGPYKDWEPPTTNVHMTYSEWLRHAKTAYNLSVLDPHYYFRVSSPDITPADIPVFLPPARGAPDSLFLKDPKAMKGVHCRFGAAGIIAEAHYDGSRNFVGEFGGPPDHPNSGRRRYILAPPAQCKFAYLLPRGHPSGRHSQIDWSRPVDLERFPQFKRLHALEVIIEPGDLLYIPHGWIHYIISLGTNFQCNARSGRNSIGADDLRDCGFVS